MHALSNNGIVVSNNNTAYFLPKPLEAKQLTNFDGKDYRYADFTTSKDYMYAVSERHISEHDVENVLVQIRLSDGHQEEIVKVKNGC